MAQTVGGQIGGVSLASFLQMLEQERKSCTLVVNCDDRSGCFYFDGGVLIDACCDDQVGEEAAFTLLSWSDTSFSVTDPEDRLQRIRQPLAHLLLTAATRHDERRYEEQQRQGTLQPGSREEQREIRVDVQGNPALRRLVETIVAMPSVKHYYLLNRQGKVITQSSKNRKVGDFITYCVVSGIQMRKVLEVKGPHRIHLVLDNGDSMLIVPGAGMIIGLLLEENASISEVTTRLRQALSKVGDS
ncbi:DUF4388 domain-containing protein [Thermodesulfobacteriota bacterium B35]